MQVESIAECSILSTFIKLPFSIKTFVLSIFKWPLKTGFTVHCKVQYLNNRQMVYLKIPVGNNAHEDTQHNIIYKHGSRQCSLSSLSSFISNQW